MIIFILFCLLVSFILQLDEDITKDSEKYK